MAKKVNLKEIKDLKKGIEEVKEIEVKGIKIEVKQYVPATFKQVIVNLTVDNSIGQLDGIYNSHIRNIMETYMITKYYTNINLSDDAYEMYDLLISTGLYKEIVSAIPFDEIDYIDELIVNTLYEEKLKSERENTFIGALQKLVNSLDIDKMKSALESFDPKVLDNIIPKHDLELLKKK